MENPQSGRVVPPLVAWHSSEWGQAPSLTVRLPPAHSNQRQGMMHAAAFEVAMRSADVGFNLRS